MATKDCNRVWNETREMHESDFFDSADTIQATRQHQILLKAEEEEEPPVPCPPVQAVVLVAAAVPVVEVVEAILPPEVRVVAIVQRQPLRLGPVWVIPPATGPRQQQPHSRLPSAAPSNLIQSSN